MHACMHVCIHACMHICVSVHMERSLRLLVVSMLRPQEYVAMNASLLTTKHTSQMIFKSP
jgi:hypothetical protein